MEQRKRLKRNALSFVLTLVMVIASMVVLMPELGMPSYAAGTYSYVERSWDGSQVVSKTKTESCTTIDSDTETISGWCAAEGKVYSLNRLKVKGEANLILCDGVEMTYPEGINVPSDATLNIYCQEGGTGNLICKHGSTDFNEDAPLGSDNEDGDCGTINIHGGKIYAGGGADKTGSYTAGIGGGDQCGGGKITIYGGSVTAEGSTSGAGIGGGDKGTGGTITIYGGEVTAKGSSGGAGIGGGDSADGGEIKIYGGTVTTDANSGVFSECGASIGGGAKGGAGEISIYGGKVNATRGPNGEGAGIGSGDEGTGGQIFILGGDITAEGGEYGAGIGGGDQGYVDLISISDATVNASGGSCGAGIGSGDECKSNKGIIRIAGGDIKATGGADAAGIGGGNQSKGGSIRIYGGKVTAEGGTNGSGIGGGDQASGSLTYITGGTVEATGGAGGAGIGGGEGEDSSSGDIEISGGNITARGGDEAAGIGSGNQGDASNSGDITISGGTVKAYGGKDYGAGIGGGDKCGSGKIIIEGGDVTAEGGVDASAIGTGDDSNKGGHIIFNGGHVTAIANNGNTPIGGQGSTAANDTKVEFNGATVLKKASGGGIKPMVYGTVTLKETDTLHQSVTYYYGESEYKAGTPSIIAPKDQRVYYIQHNEPAYVLVGPCDHRNSTYGGHGSNIYHYRSCENCGLTGAQEDHIWGKASYEWKSDNSEVSALHSCTACERMSGAVAKTKAEITKPASCNAEGETTYTATFYAEGFETQTKTVADIEVDPNAHDWNNPTYEWASDYSKVTAMRVCKNNDEHKETEEVSTTCEITKPATCQENGEKIYTATFKNEVFEAKSKTVEIPASESGHKWVKVREYQDEKYCGRKVIEYECEFCDNTKFEGVDDSDDPHEWGEWTEFSKPTCTEQGMNVRYCKKCGIMDYSEFQFTDPLGHGWGEPGYTWADDNSSVTAKRVCQRENCGAEETETENTTSEVTKAPTCEKKGETTYMAYFENAAFAKQIKKEDIDALEHDWSDPSYTWSEDLNKVTAERVCKNDPSHIEEETVETTSEVTKEPDCEEKGETTYTAEFTNDAFMTQTKVSELKPFGHNFGEWEKLDDKQHQRVCTHDESHVEKEDHTWDDGTVTKEPTERAEGVKTYTCNVCKATRTESIPKLYTVLVAKGVAKGKTAAKISWKKVSGADRYVIYLGRCNHKGSTYKMKKVKTVSANKSSWTKKKLRRNTAYKFYVVAQKKSGGSYSNMAKSLTGHFFTGKTRGKYTDPKSVKLKKSSITLTKGKSATIKASVAKAKKNKKLATSHAARLRYISNNPSVATVSSKGKVTAKSSGTAVIYVQTINGIWKTCKVTVR